MNMALQWTRLNSFITSLLDGFLSDGPKQKVGQKVWWFFSITLALYLFASFKLMRGLDFNDETEKLLASELMRHGLRLYKDIFVQHGPFVYMLSHLFDVLTGNNELYWPRVIPIALSLLSVAAVAASPLWHGMRTRVVTATLTLWSYLFLLAIYSLVMTMYQVYAGYLFVIPLSLSFLPALFGIRLQRWHLICSGLALAAIGLDAFSFGIAIAISTLALAAAYLPDWREVRRVLGWLMVGALIMTGIVGLWLAIYGDWFGYFLYHIYFNLTTYRHYLGAPNYFLPFYTFFPAEIKMVYPLADWCNWYDTVLYSLPFLSMAVIFFIARRGARPAKTISLFFLALALHLAILYMNPRLSMGFGATMFVIIASAMAVMAMIMAFRQKEPAYRRLGILLAACVFLSGGIAQFMVKTKLYEAPVRRYYKTHGPVFKDHSAPYNLARTIVGPDEGILQFPFDLGTYVAVGRRPASGIFFWLPWMADYAKSPVPGYPLDVCHFIETQPPKLIYFHDMAIWRNPTDVWMGCIKKILSQRYVRVLDLGPMGWVRADIVAARPDLMASAVITPDLDLSKIPAAARGVFRGRMLSFGRLQQGGQCLAFQSPDYDPDTRNMVAEKCENAPQFSLQPTQNGVSELLWHDDLLCLEVKGSSKDVGAPMRLWPCMGVENQAFFVKKMMDGSLELRNQFSDRCLTINGGKVTQNVCDATTRWKFSPGNSN